ncbi:MAG: hypothetical protein D6791_04340 [Chloroflexi bacterium]|nr:MAG: hypothetical protein D6791_04340 [Chloroflexota bacterium]
MSQVKLFLQSNTERAFLALVLLWAIALYMFRATIGWVWPLNSIVCVFPLFLIFTGWLLALIVASLIYPLRQLLRRKFDFRAFFPFLFVVVTVLFEFKLPLPPTKPELVFRRHRQEFMDLTELAVSTYRETRDFQFPQSDLYAYAIIYSCDNLEGDGCHAVMTPDYSHPPEKVIIEYIIDDFYLPLVYVRSDNAVEVYNTCSAGGQVVKRIETHWYVCRRDFN